MKFIHPHFGIEIDTESKELEEHLDKLNTLYSELPETKCLNCPSKCKVEADCCKVFSPPMNLIEFINIFRNVVKMSQKQKSDLAMKCVDSLVNPDYFKSCTLLDGIDCSHYLERPFSCRLFGLYTKGEYERRVRQVSKEIPEYVDLPFKEQCTNLEYENGKNEIYSAHSDRIFKEIHELDQKLFSSFPEKEAKDIVMSSCTYMTFELHYLSIVLGPDVVDILVGMKNELRKAKNAHMLDKSSIANSLTFQKKEKQVKDFLEEIKKGLIPEEVSKEE